jgi:hypothetical protein
MKDAVINTLVRRVLEEEDRTWTYQGFGMLRTYLDPAERLRLNIWDPASATDNVSMIHDHTWDFTSYVVCGHVVNHVFRVDNRSSFGEPYLGHRIRTGEGGGPTRDEPFKCRLIEQEPGLIGRCDSYRQHHLQLHYTEALPGTITINDRELIPGPKIATVCWKEGAWVSAEPRPATAAEVQHFTKLATRLL